MKWKTNNLKYFFFFEREREKLWLCEINIEFLSSFSEIMNNKQRKWPRSFSLASVNVSSQLIRFSEEVKDTDKVSKPSLLFKQCRCKGESNLVLRCGWWIVLIDISSIHIDLNTSISINRRYRSIFIWLVVIELNDFNRFCILVFY